MNVRVVQLGSTRAPSTLSWSKCTASKCFLPKGFPFVRRSARECHSRVGIADLVAQANRWVSRMEVPR